MVRSENAEFGRLWRRVAVAVVAGVFLLTGVAGCSSEGAETQCSLNDCTVTFDRGVDAQVNVLGVKAKLVDVKGNEATIEVAGEQIVVPAGGEATAGGFQVAVQEITDQKVVVKISQAE